MSTPIRGSFEVFTSHTQITKQFIALWPPMHIDNRTTGIVGKSIR